jgi:hypothetical protein
MCKFRLVFCSDSESPHACARAHLETEGKCDLKLSGNIRYKVMATCVSQLVYNTAFETVEQLVLRCRPQFLSLAQDPWHALITNCFNLLCCIQVQGSTRPRLLSERDSLLEIENLLLQDISPVHSGLRGDLAELGSQQVVQQRYSLDASNV